MRNIKSRGKTYKPVVAQDTRARAYRDKRKIGKKAIVRKSGKMWIVYKEV